MKEAELLINLPFGLSFWKMEHHEPIILACLLPVFKRRDWSVPWGIKGIKLAIRHQEILEEIFCSERIWEKSTDLECKLQPIPEAVGQRGGNIMRKFLSRTRALTSLSNGMVRELLRTAPIRQVTR